MSKRTGERCKRWWLKMQDMMEMNIGFWAWQWLQRRFMFLLFFCNVMYISHCFFKRISGTSMTLLLLLLYCVVCISPTRRKFYFSCFMRKHYYYFLPLFPCGYNMLTYDHQVTLLFLPTLFLWMQFSFT